MVHLLVEDVTILRGELITLHVRFRGGATRTVTLPNPLRSWESWMTDVEVVSKIDQLLDTQTFSEIAATLNRDGFRSGKGSASPHATSPAFKSSMGFVRGSIGYARLAF